MKLHTDHQYQASSKSSLKSQNFFSYRSLLLVLWLGAMAQIILTIIKRDDSLIQQQSLKQRFDDELTSTTRKAFNQATGPFGVLFAEAGKKKKKEKSEVVVISVQNTPAKGGMYPIFVPSCSGGHGGYGRRKRSITYL